MQKWLRHRARPLLRDARHVRHRAAGLLHDGKSGSDIAQDMSRIMQRQAGAMKKRFRRTSR
jgi:hypothetical protein